MKLSDLSKATEDRLGKVEKATTQEAIDAVAGKYPDAAGVKAHVDSAVVAHKDEVDPHTQYETKVEVDKRLLRESLLKEATLNLDFANNRYEVYEGPVDNLTAKPFNDIVTFTRASAASARNAVGGLSPVLTDQQRLVGNREGLLIEGQRTNEYLQSQEFSTNAWATDSTGITVTPDDGPELISGKLADRIDFTATSSRVSQNYAGDAERANTFCVRYISGNAEILVVTRTQDAVFNIVDGIVVSGDGFIEPEGKGFYRCTLVGTNPSSRAAMRTAGGGGSYHVAYAQLEAGSFPTSYIKTEGSQVTRSADNASVALGSEFNPMAGTFMVELSWTYSLTAHAGQRMFTYRASDNVNLRTISAYRDSDNNAIAQIFGGTTIIKNLGAMPVGKNKLAISYVGSGDGSFASLNGSPAVNIGSISGIGDFSGADERLNIGSLEGSSQLLNGKAAFIKYFPRALTQSEIQILTSED